MHITWQHISGQSTEVGQRRKEALVACKKGLSGVQQQHNNPLKENPFDALQVLGGSNQLLQP